jgi:putative transposase
MSQPYQIQRGRAIRQFRQFAQEKNRVVQLLLPMAEIAGLLQEGVGKLMREVVGKLMLLVMSEEVRQLVGEKHQVQTQRRAYRWGQEDGFFVVDGQKVRMRRQRVRDREQGEIQLGSYELFRRSEPLRQSVWEQLMAGISTRAYAPLVKQFAEAYGVEKTVVSDRFIEASRQQLKQLLERGLGEVRLLAILIDGVQFKQHHLVVALGIGQDGSKSILGLREGASENATVTSQLLEDLVGRGLDCSHPCLWIVDGSKALHSAVQRHAGPNVQIQRCQLHKRRNVCGHLPEEHQTRVDRKLRAAYAMTHYEEARGALQQVLRELMDLNPSAARSLEEGLEETLTVHRLKVPELLRKSLASTNVIESAFSRVETICRNVKRWRNGDQVERWVGSGLLVAQKRFRRVKGYREIPQVVETLQALVPKKQMVKRTGTR